MNTNISYRVIKNRNKKMLIMLKIVCIMCIILSVHFLITSYIIGAVRINSTSMEPTIANASYLFYTPLFYGNHHLFSKKVGWQLKKPNYNDIILIKQEIQTLHIMQRFKNYILHIINLGHHNIDTQQIYIRRIIGLPGDTLILEGNKLYRQLSHVPTRQLIAEFASGFFTQSHTRYFNKSITVPDNQYFISADNPQALDSRFFGTVSNEMIYGRIIMQLLPQFHSYINN